MTFLSASDTIRGLLWRPVLKESCDIYKGRKHDTLNVPADRTLQGLLRRVIIFVHAQCYLLRKSDLIHFHESRYIKYESLTVKLDYINDERNTAIARYRTLAKDFGSCYIGNKASQRLA